MTYHYEQLGDERFQQLAQALLSSAFPNVQCLPVGQPDGGRDAFLVQTQRHAQKRTFVFQVKYSRDPSAKSERDSVTSLIKAEREKVISLKKRGVSAYYFITNVSGTAHLDSGSVDIVNRELTAAFEMPSYCWWRDDLDRRIDAASDIKWSYPDIIRGSDVLQILVEGTWRDNSDLRNQAIRSYIAAQCKDDEEVKFKQVELQNKLLDLFVDLPVANIGEAEAHRHFWMEMHSGEVGGSQHEEDLFEMEYVPLHRRRNLPNTASLLLRDLPPGRLSSIVLEGAPGQGKSTITQYVCQVNRLKLLGRRDELAGAPNGHLDAPVRVPFRVDLRDYATWLAGRNPFVPEGQLEAVKSPSLESFIAAQVSHLSGGQEFSASDLVAIAKNGRVSLILDGFDEVADISTRQRVVDEISRTASRIQAHQQNAQIVVTSRPAAFANSPGFPHNEWAHLELQSMTTGQIDEYAKKWMTARHLQAKERAEFIKLLKEKLEQPHMRDLSRNPMQLTILLALIHTRGLSLPDKRTSLYDNYMELFFNRESEKSRVVREHRDLLIDIHRYLAWKLHTAAEAGNSGGSITEENLKRLLRSYLESEGHNSSLVQELFTGMVERVVALVSRVQGTFEFEVQPLREYFAARHLYETAPYSPPGDERRGTKPERFDALARNFYWLNVVRFYCGCFSRGELSSLVDGLNQLAVDEDYRLLAHPRILSLMLLNDWVFSQQPLLVSRVVASLFESPGLKILLSGSGRTPTSEIILPDKCGRGELIERAYTALQGPLTPEDRSSINEILRRNVEVAPRYECWLAREPIAGELTEWLQDGYDLGLLSALQTGQLSSIAERHPMEIGPLLSRARRYDVIYAVEPVFDCVVEQSLAGSGVFHFSEPGAGKKKTSLQVLENILSPFLYQSFFSSDFATRAMLTRHGVHSAVVHDPYALNSAEAIAVSEVVAELLPLFQSDFEAWTISLQPWQALFEILKKRFGTSWAILRLCVLAAGIKSSSEVGRWSSDGWSDRTTPLQSMRYARLRSGNVNWWKTQIRTVGDCASARKLLLLSLIVWATPRTILAVAEEASALVDALGSSDWTSLHQSYVEVLWSSQAARKKPRNIGGVLPENLSPRLLTMIGRRGDFEFTWAHLMDRLAEYQGSDTAIRAFVGELALKNAVGEPSHWEDFLELMKSDRCGASGLFNLEIAHGEGLETMPEHIAREVCEKAAEFPQFLVRLAQNRLASATGAKAAKVGDIAEQEAWF